MSILYPEIEYVDKSTQSIRYLEHGWPSNFCRWHSHDEFELHLITKTEGRAFIGDYIGVFQEGALFLTGPNLPHNWITHGNDEISLRDMLVQFNFQTIKQLADAFPEFKAIYPTLELASFGIEFSGYDAAKATSYLSHIRDSKGPSRIIHFLDFLLSIHNHQDKKTLSVNTIFQPNENSKYARLATVIDYVSKNYAENISLNQAADMAGMSAATFSQNFQKVTGKKFVEFVNSIRISQACSMLYLSDHLISTICYDIGFQNLANFNRHFFKMKDMSPTQYRNLARTEISQQSKNNNA